jgi:hypothetical protein
MSLDLECPKLYKLDQLVAIGEWLNSNMPNPPLPEVQRWTIGESIDGRVGINFSNDEDATWFGLVWI